MSTTFVPTRARLTVAQFQKMGEAGILPPDSRIELIDGEMLEMGPIGPPHVHREPAQPAAGARARRRGDRLGPEPGRARRMVRVATGP